MNSQAASITASKLTHRNVRTASLRSNNNSSRRIGPTIGLRLVDAERIELGELVQEAGLRRDRHRQLGGRDQDRLAQLPVPSAIGELASLEGGEIEFRRLE